MPLRARQTLLLDLDGTLIDPAVGIVACYRHALAELGLGVPDGEDLRWVIGPPMRETFAGLLSGRADPERAVQLYRERYAEWGLYQAKVYDGVQQVLMEHARRGTRLVLCTAKPRVFAVRVVEHFGLSPHLAAVYGPELDGRFDDKGDLIAHLLMAEKLDPADVCMVGDRRHDVVAAARHEIPTIGVLSGYGGKEELTEAGAAMIIERPEELLPPNRP
jgi:phosphoglycolate phosphatase